MKRLYKRCVMLICLQMNIPTILQICKTCKKFNEWILKNDVFWNEKLRKDCKLLKSIENSKSYYKIMYLSTGLQNGLNRASEMGYLDLVLYFVEKFKQREKNSPTWYSFNDDIDWSQGLYFAAYGNSNKEIIDYFIDKTIEHHDKRKLASGYFGAYQGKHKKLTEFFQNLLFKQGYPLEK